MTEKLETPTLAEVVDAFHTLFPPQLAAGWDASGLVAGRAAAKVSTVLFAVDALTATAEEAVVEGAQLLITHHPLLLRGAKFIPDSDYKGNVLHTLIEGGCGLLGAHTNADAAVEGVNEALCDAIGLIDREPLTEAQTQVLDGQEHAVGTAHRTPYLKNHPQGTRGTPRSGTARNRRWPAHCGTRRPADPPRRPLRWCR